MFKRDIKTSSMSMFIADVVMLVDSQEWETLKARYFLDKENAIFLTKVELSIELSLAIHKYNNEFPYRGLPFLQENIEYFMDLFTWAVLTFTKAEEALMLGMPKSYLSILLNLNPKFISRFIKRSGIPKNSGRKISSQKDILTIDEQCDLLLRTKGCTKGRVLTLTRNETLDFLFRLARITHAGINQILGHFKDYENRIILYQQPEKMEK